MITSQRDLIVHEISAAVREIVPTVTEAEITGGKHLRELGADSVDRVEIIATVLGRLGVDEPLASFAGLPDIDSMADLLQKRMNR